MERESLRCLKWGFLFLYIDFHVGTLNLLPAFVGMLLLYASIRAHREKRRPEEKLKPLLLALAGDGFLHWIWRFENGLESLLATVVALYVMYVLLGEAAERIRLNQPRRAAGLDRLRAAEVLFQVVVFVVQPVGGEGVNLALTLGGLGMYIALMATVCGIRPEEGIR